MSTQSEYYESIKGKLTGFGQNAREDAGRIMALVQGLQVPEKEVMKIVQNVLAKGDSDPQGSSLRKKAEAFLDRVYSTNPMTAECSQVRRLDFSSSHGADALLTDLRNWRQDVVPDFLSEALGEESI